MSRKNTSGQSLALKNTVQAVRALCCEMFRTLPKNRCKAIELKPWSPLLPAENLEWRGCYCCITAPTEKLVWFSHWSSGWLRTGRPKGMQGGYRGWPRGGCGGALVAWKNWMRPLFETSGDYWMNSVTSQSYHNTIRRHRALTSAQSLIYTVLTSDDGYTRWLIFTGICWHQLPSDYLGIRSSQDVEIRASWKLPFAKMRPALGEQVKRLITGDCLCHQVHINQGVWPRGYRRDCAPLR